MPTGSVLFVVCCTHNKSVTFRTILLQLTQKEGRNEPSLHFSLVSVVTTDTSPTILCTQRMIGCREKSFRKDRAFRPGNPQRSDVTFLNFPSLLFLRSSQQPFHLHQLPPPRPPKDRTPEMSCHYPVTRRSCPPPPRGSLSPSAATSSASLTTISILFAARDLMYWE